MSHINLKSAFLFPGQGAQYVGMGKDFVRDFSSARLLLEEADDLLNQSFSSIILNGPENTLTETKNSQVAIYLTSLLILTVVQELTGLQPYICAGLSLGEYTALTASKKLSFASTLRLVKHRAQFMNEACQKTKGTMAVVMGLEAEEVEKITKKISLPHDLWIANFNCPGQVVLSGTLKGIEIGTIQMKEHGAKRVIPLQVSGAFHSGLMQNASDKLAPYILEAPLTAGNAQLVMNVSGDIVTDNENIKKNLIKQVSHSVCWEQGIRTIDKQGIDIFIEFGPGKTLSGMNKKIGVRASTISFEKVEDLSQLSRLDNKE
jgi:[acyl-carrier-protein] S-malonyltransferase